MAYIFIADDEKDLVDLLTFLLRKDGHEIVSANNGKDALAMIQEVPPDLILLDVMMPEMDGYAVHAKLTENPATRNIPIIVLTAKAKMRDLFEVATNVIAYLEKPFDPKVLREKVQEALTKQ